MSHLPPKWGSTYNEVLWESTTQRWQSSQQRRTLQRDADHHRQYLLHGHSLQHAGCVGKPVTRMARQHIFMCILHRIMAVGRLVVQFLEALCSDLDKVLRARVQSIFDGARTGIHLGSAASPDGEGVYRLLQAWEQEHEGACPDATHPGGRVVLEMRELLLELYPIKQHGPAPHCRGPASRFRENVAPKSCSHYLLLLEEHYDYVLAALQPRSMAMMSRDIVESVKRILKVGYNDHSDCGRGCAEHPKLREARVVAKCGSGGFYNSMCHSTPGASQIRRHVYFDGTRCASPTSHSHAPLPTSSSMISAWMKAPSRR